MTSTSDQLLKSAQALVDSITVDVSGIPGMPFSGNGGLVSTETVKRSDALRLAIHRHEKERGA